MSKIQLIQGDCLVEMKKIPDGSVDLVLTDPPYGTTACKWDTVIPFEPMWEQLKRVTKKNGAIVLFGSQPFTSALVMSNPKMFKYEWVWIKNKAVNFFNVKKMPLFSKEDVVLFYEKQPTYNPQGATDTLKLIKNPKGHGTKKHISGHNGGVVTGTYIRTKEGYPRQELYFPVVMKPLHPTQKPVTLMEYLIKTYTNEGETVLDFTMGSGTTGVACKNLNRNFIGIELDKEYFEIAKSRIDKSL